MAEQVRTFDAICVYCASSMGSDPSWGAAADEVGELLAGSGIRLVYGGGKAGLMGRVADACLAAGGQVTGVIPVGLFDREVAHRGLSELIEVQTMHERKTIMFERADAFIALPGGFGTLEEVAEVITWGQIGVHTKPIACVDLKGYWTPLFDFIERAVSEGLMKESNARLVSRAESVATVLDVLRAYDAPYEPKWLDSSDL
jgi:uncharacterized protein (TIGR00730 family)